MDLIYNIHLETKKTNLRWRNQHLWIKYKMRFSNKKGWYQTKTKSEVVCNLKDPILNIHFETKENNTKKITSLVKIWDAPLGQGGMV